ncbi:MAG: GAF domain-containing protein, partial [Terriglobales bacterium]
MRASEASDGFHAEGPALAAAKGNPQRRREARVTLPNPAQPSLVARVLEILAGGGGRVEKARSLADAIRRTGNFRWVGLYEVGSDEIAVVAWSGPGKPAFPRFPAALGLCGAAAASGQSVYAPDVAKDERYLTTLSTTRSEIVVPVHSQGSSRPVGLIDVDSETVEG